MKQFITPFFFACLAAFGLTWALHATRDQKPVSLEDFHPAPAFTLTDQHAQPFSTDSLRGKVWVFNLFFTSCQGPCPLIMGEVKALIKEFKDDGPVEYVSVSVDPSKDTPEALAQYRAKMGGRGHGWHLLTGPFEEVKRISIDGFKLGLDEAALHSTRLVLVDGKGTIRGYFDSRDPDKMTELRGAITYLLTHPE